MGNVVVGLQIEPESSKDFDDFLKTLAYPYVEESGNYVFQAFLRG